MEIGNTQAVAHTLQVSSPSKTSRRYALEWIAGSCCNGLCRFGFAATPFYHKQPHRGMPSTRAATPSASAHLPPRTIKRKTYHPVCLRPSAPTDDETDAMSHTTCPVRDKTKQQKTQGQPEIRTSRSFVARLFFGDRLFGWDSQNRRGSHVLDGSGHRAQTFPPSVHPHVNRTFCPLQYHIHFARSCFLFF